MNMTDTTPTESNLSGLDRKDFQKNIKAGKQIYISSKMLRAWKWR